MSFVGVRCGGHKLLTTLRGMNSVSITVNPKGEHGAKGHKQGPSAGIKHRILVSTVKPKRAIETCACICRHPHTLTHIILW